MKFIIVDVFGLEKFTGNQLAVVILEKDIPKEEMQMIAKLKIFPIKKHRRKPPVPSHLPGRWGQINLIYITRRCIKTSDIIITGTLDRFIILINHFIISPYPAHTPFMGINHGFSHGHIRPGDINLKTAKSP